MSESAHTLLSPLVRKLPNGLTVIAEHLPYVHSASVGVWIRTGSADEDAQHAGISHFLEHLFFKGTKTRTARELMDAIESRGGHMNAFTTREHTCLYVKTLDHHTQTAVEILADIIQHSTFCDLDKERSVILEEIASGKDSPDEHVHDLLSETMWPDHPLGRPIAGFEETVSRTKLKDVRAYKELRYRPENMYVALVGNFDEEQFFELVEDSFGGMSPGFVETVVTVPEFHADSIVEGRAIGQNHVVCAFPGISVTDPSRYAYDVLSSVLGGGSTSRLFESIREREGLAYAIFSFNAMFQAAGMFGFYAAVGPDNLQRTVDLCIDELHKMQDGPIPDEELLSNREQLKGGLLLALEGTFNRMARMVRSLMLFDRLVSVDEILEAVDRVTAGDVQRLAQSVFTKEQCALAVLGPEDVKSPVLNL